MNIYHCYYGHMCGNYKAVVIAKDKADAEALFKEYDKEIGNSTVKKLGVAGSRSKRGVVMFQENY